MTPLDDAASLPVGELIPVAVWLAQNGRFVEKTPDGFSVADDEVTLEVSRVGKGWEIHKVWRDDDRGIVFSASSAEDVDRYLTVLTANEVRNRHGLPMIRHGVETGPDGLAKPCGDFVLSGELDRGFILRDTSDDRSWRFARDVEAARFSRYMAISPDRLRTELLSPSSTELVELIEFARDGGWEWRQSDDALFEFVTGDPDDVCTLDNALFTMRKRERGVLSEPFVATARLDVLDRFLSLRYGPDVHNARGRPPLAMPVDPTIVETPPEGVTVVFRPEGFLVEWTEEGRTRSASALSRIGAAQLITYGRQSASAIRAAFVQAD
jgi:hypothetical protein